MRLFVSLDQVVRMEIDWPSAEKNEAITADKRGAKIPTKLPE